MDRLRSPGDLRKSLTPDELIKLRDLIGSKLATRVISSVMISVPRGQGGYYVDPEMYDLLRALLEHFKSDCYRVQHRAMVDPEMHGLPGDLLSRIPENFRSSLCRKLSTKNTKNLHLKADTIDLTDVDEAYVVRVFGDDFNAWPSWLRIRAVCDRYKLPKLQELIPQSPTNNIIWTDVKWRQKNPWNVQEQRMMGVQHSKDLRSLRRFSNYREHTCMSCTTHFTGRKKMCSVFQTLCLNCYKTCVLGHCECAVTCPSCDGKTHVAYINYHCLGYDKKICNECTKKICKMSKCWSCEQRSPHIMNSRNSDRRNGFGNHRYVREVLTAPRVAPQIQEFNFPLPKSGRRTKPALRESEQDGSTSAPDDS